MPKYRCRRECLVQDKEWNLNQYFMPGQVLQFPEGVTLEEVAPEHVVHFTEVDESHVGMSRDYEGHVETLVYDEKNPEGGNATMAIKDDGTMGTQVVKAGAATIDLADKKKAELFIIAEDRGLQPASNRTKAQLIKMIMEGN